MSNYRRIKKPQARLYYNSGKEIFLLPSKAVMNSLWIQPYSIQKDRLEGEVFDKIINTFEYYNCSPLVGTYTHFYVEEQ